MVTMLANYRRGMKSQRVLKSGKKTSSGHKSCGIKMKRAWISMTCMMAEGETSAKR